MLPGIDISNHQGHVNMDLIARSGYQWVSMKVSEATYYADPYFKEDWAAAKALGLGRVAYHFARPSVASGHAEAAFMLPLLLPDWQTGDVFALDSEDTRVSPTADLLAHHMDFYSVADAALGRPGLFYSAHWYAPQHNLTGHPDTLGKHGLWLANYDITAYPAALDGWPFIAIWQYSANQTVPGVVGPCDADLFNGTLDQLKAYGKP